MTIANAQVIEASDVLTSARYRTVEAGENITAGEVVYVNLNDGKAYVSDTGTADDIRASGIALTTATSGNNTAICIVGSYTTSGLTAGEIYYLGAAGAISTTASGVRIGRAASTTELTIDIVQDDAAAVGTIKAYIPDFTGIPANNLTAFWVLCDGSTISDSESPLDGQTLPDLNGSNLFLRSADTSGGTGGATTHTHSQQNYSRKYSGADAAYGSASNIPPYYDVVRIIKIK